MANIVEIEHLGTGSAETIEAVTVVNEPQNASRPACVFEAESIRRGFAESATEFARVTQLLAESDFDWNAPVGDSGWNLRTIIGHTSRALRTPISYLERGRGLEPTLNHPFDYFAMLGSDYSSRSAILERAERAAETLGSNPAEHVRTLAQEAVQVVDATPDGAPVSTVVGVMTLCSYLPSRVMVLTSDTGALAESFGIEPQLGDDAARIAFLMSVGVAAEAPTDVDVLRMGVPSVTAG